MKERAMNIFLGVLLYLIPGLLFVVWAGRRGALETDDNKWALVWLIWPITILLIIYLLVNALVRALIEVDV